ncbi:bifunctional 4-hydroxy-3-methylbut-2-enyl diphosphate reductase/30S ribosomal protein S1 [Gelria sp. Kuro-4]|uniref:bifunctional 4-hydroxy-3-methylbut-2-enyl diphosphate reductase/30S ribosomal protein S1 n=1 Tax=Gelria sp. Kuro-4 TaxID=2796927 RepID=UPI001BF0FB95|nr:bifunctional 4-hydroxy-3-methylbut-2-enyl diphosphate reductase/30S ribosomal protein S1 [Gelria sp. Kuro-4]BCV25095.1 4-hydroxy-3-methylbut-2-enyl diphosphate reductase [Gelria sp. Kuro-4]
MQVIRANPSGFCPGVRAAINLARQALGREGRVYSWGPLVHNESVVAALARAGVRPIADLSEAEVTGALIIRAHGVGPADIKAAVARGFRIYDGTCPRVKKVQRLAQELLAAGENVFLVGEKEHPEVRGILAWAGGPVTVINSVKEVEELPAVPARVALVAQTTVTLAHVQAIAAALRQRGAEVTLYDTLCFATTERQAAARELARQVDVMIVVGSHQSANTRRLVEVCQAEGVPTYLVNSAGELRPEWLAGKDSVGVTAGASAPEEIIEEVCGRMSEEYRAEQKLAEGVEKVESQEAPATEATNQPDAQNTEQSPADETATTKTGESVEDLYAKSFLSLQEGQVVTGKVVRVDNDGVLVDVAYKSEGVIPPAELSDKPYASPEEVVQLGQEVKVVVVKVDAEGNNLILSKRRADQEEAWEELKRHYENGEPVEGQVLEVVKGGLIVFVGLRAFMPASQVGLRYEADLSHYVGQTLKAKIIEIEPQRRRVILSHRTVLEAERAAKREALWAELEEGQVRHGRVTKLTDFGAFVDLGGAEGLVHISELSWSRVRHPSEVVHEGDEVDVKVLRLDRERGRISLGLKQVKPDPWTEIRQSFPVGTVHEGVVTNILNFGAFVKLADGIEGLVHISQLAPRHVGHPSEVVQIGQRVKVKVLDINEDKRRISLSIKQVPPELQPLAPAEEHPAPEAAAAEPSADADTDEKIE